MTIALGLLAVLALILANGYFVAAEFAFVAVRKGKLEEAAAASDGRGERERWRCCASCRSCCRAPQLGITATSLIVGCIAEPTLGRAFAPLLGAVGLGETAARGVTLTVGFVLATVGQMVLGELGPSNLALAEPERLRWPSTASLPSSSTTPSPASRTHNHPTGPPRAASWTTKATGSLSTPGRPRERTSLRSGTSPPTLPTCSRRSPRRCVTRPRWCGPTARPP